MEATPCRAEKDALACATAADGPSSAGAHLPASLVPADFQAHVRRVVAEAGVPYPSASLNDPGSPAIALLLAVEARLQAIQVLLERQAGDAGR